MAQQLGVLRLVSTDMGLLVLFLFYIDLGRVETRAKNK